MVRAKAFFGVTTLVLGLIALGLAVIPRAFFNVPPPWPKEPAPQPHQVTEGGKSIEWKGIKVTFGGTTKTIPPPPSPPTPAVSISFATATAVVALLGLGLGVFACRLLWLGYQE